MAKNFGSAKSSNIIRQFKNENELRNFVLLANSQRDKFMSVFKQLFNKSHKKNNKILEEKEHFKKEYYYYLRKSETLENMKNDLEKLLSVRNKEYLEEIYKNKLLSGEIDYLEKTNEQLKKEIEKLKR